MTIRETAQRLADALEAIPAYSIRERATFSGAVQLLRQWPEAAPQDKGIPRKGCQYLAPADSVCNKCGEIHHHHQMLAHFYAAPSQQPAPARPDEFVCPHCFDEGAAPQAAQSGMVPVMWMHDAGDMITNAAWVQSSDRAKEWYHTPLVVVAPQAVPQPLTDEHVDEIWDGTFDSADPKRKLSFRQSITRAIERAHGIGITAKGDGNG